ncbi:MAG: hypothetical protein K5770_13715 [Lachnospiraceae bacterium]|nr:hypothetical protein [Lachnospiraceae bacterium]
MAYNRKNGSVFDQMMQECMREDNITDYLDECMTFSVKLAERVPLRYRLIAQGFARRLSLEELNESLLKHGCARLYSRNIWEATIIFAFINGIPYSEWKTLYNSTFEISKEVESENRYFSGRKITFEEIERYVFDNSEIRDGELYTRHMTEILNNRIYDAINKKKDFMSFLEENVTSFSVTREKTRYYFCKYLYYSLKQGIENIIAAQKAGINLTKNIFDNYDVESMIDENYVFRCMSTLIRKSMSEEEMRETLRTSPVSCAVIYDGFNQFFYNYISLDWMDILYEEYEARASGDLKKNLTDNEKKFFAEAVKKYNPKWRHIDDDNIIMDRIAEHYTELEESRDNDSTNQVMGLSNQKGRAGENTIRSFIKGSLDLNRTSFICFLIYFGNRAEGLLPQDMIVTRERLSEILLESGFPALREEDDFDDFIIEYLESDDPSDILSWEVRRYALNGENSPIFEPHRNLKRSYDEEKALIK